MHLIGSLALVCCLLLGFVAPWDLKDDYFKDDYDRNKKCEQEERILQMENRKNLHQCSNLVAQPGQRSRDECKKDVEKKKHLCGDKEDIIYCYNSGWIVCCYNNAPCAKDDAVRFNYYSDKLDKVEKEKKEQKKKSRRAR